MKLRVTLEAETSLIPDLQDCKTVQKIKTILFTQAEESPVKGLKLVGVDLADKSAPTEGGESLKYDEWEARACVNFDNCPVKNKNLHCYANKPCFK